MCTLYFKTYTINYSDMSFSEALFVSEREGVSIVPTYYSVSAKNDVQYYFNQSDKKFYCQNLDQKPRVYNVAQERYSQRWEVYYGSYPQYHKSLEYKKARFEELSKKLKEHFSDFQEYKELEKEIHTFK
jgi:hypothetical protein